MARFKESEEDGEFLLTEVVSQHRCENLDGCDLGIWELSDVHKFKTAEEREQYKLQHA